MPITCFIRYEIDPFQKDQFTAYANNWARIIPRLGVHLLGYFVPHEGSNYEALRAQLLPKSGGVKGLLPAGSAHAKQTPLGRKHLAGLRPSVDAL